MIDVNYLAIAVATVAAVVLSTAYYMVFAKQMAALSAAAADSARPPAWKILVELVRSLVVASVLAGFASKLGITDWTGAVLLGLTVWIGFPVVLLLGSVIWENVPLKLAALHARRRPPSIHGRAGFAVDVRLRGPTVASEGMAPFGPACPGGGNQSGGRSPIVVAPLLSQ